MTGLALGVVAFAGGAAAPAAAAGRTAPSGDYVVGSAVNAFPVPVVGPGQVRLDVWARSTATGARPAGTVRATGDGGAPGTGFTVSGPVTCLRVEGNRASIKYAFTQADGAAAPLQGGGVEVFVEDNGHFRGQARSDANAFGTPMPAGAFRAAGPGTCDDPTAGLYTTVRSGGYTVRDQPATP